MSVTLLRRQDRLTKLAVLSACLALVLCVSIACGWYFDISFLRNPFADGGTVSLGACSLFALLSLAALLRFIPNGNMFARLACGFCGGIAAVFAGLKAAETMASAEWLPSIQIMVPGEDRNPLSLPGAISPDVCVLVALYGLSLVLLPVKLKLKKWFVYQLLVLLGSAVSLLPILGYISGQESLCTIYGCIRQPVLVTFISLLTAFAMLFADVADSPLVDAARDDRAGGNLRAVLWLALVACPAAVVLKSLLVSTGFADQGLASAVTMAALIVFAGKLILSAPSQSAAPEAVALPEAPQIPQEEIREVLTDSTVTVSTTITGNRQPSKVALAACFRCPECLKEYDKDLDVCPDDGAALGIVLVDRLIGSVFAEKYRIEAFLGKGGMSTVYLAKHVLMGKHVAIKLMHSNIRMNEAAIRRFHAEAKAMSRLSHQNVLQALDFGFFDGMPYLIMDLVEGISLSQRLKSGGVLSLPEFFQLSNQVCFGLSHAHLHGIVHRDLKPANIMLLPREGKRFQVKIVDFGLAKMTEIENGGGLEATAAKLTQTGDCMGSPLYMSPEQCTGSPVDHRSDVYSLGCVFYESLTGNGPFDSVFSVLEVMHAHIAMSPNNFPADSAVPHSLQQVIFRMLSKEPADRQQSIEQVQTEVRREQEQLVKLAAWAD